MTQLNDLLSLSNMVEEEVEEGWVVCNKSKKAKKPIISQTTTKLNNQIVHRGGGKNNDNIRTTTSRSFNNKNNNGSQGTTKISTAGGIAKGNYRNRNTSDNAFSDKINKTNDEGNTNYISDGGSSPMAVDASYVAISNMDVKADNYNHNGHHINDLNGRIVNEDDDANTNNTSDSVTITTGHQYVKVSIPHVDDIMCNNSHLNNNQTDSVDSADSLDASISTHDITPTIEQDLSPASPTSSNSIPMDTTTTIDHVTRPVRKVMNDEEFHALIHYVSMNDTLSIDQSNTIYQPR